jgi:C1A family cysteine protease
MRYGWIPDLPDQRDHRFNRAALGLTVAALPPSVDLRPQCPPVYDQGQLGSCTANAISAALEFERAKQGLAAFMPSRLFIYYNERAMEGTIPSDSGAQIRDGIKSVGSQGDCPETEWPYDPSQFATMPPPSCYADGVKYKAVTYAAVAQDLNDLKGCLAAGYPFVFGFTVYQSFESQTGVVPMPGWFESTVGGHAVMAVGYDDSQQRFIVRNSWGEGWGLGGYFTQPYDYLTDPKLASDFWTIRLVQAQ